MTNCKGAVTESAGDIPSETVALNVVLIAEGEVPVRRPPALKLKPPGRPVDDHVYTGAPPVGEPPPVAVSC
jgi:hypothetical protein